MRSIYLTTKPHTSFLHHSLSLYPNVHVPQETLIYIVVVLRRKLFDEKS